MVGGGKHYGGGHDTIAQCLNWNKCRAEGGDTSPGEYWDVRLIMRP